MEQVPREVADPHGSSTQPDVPGDDKAPCWTDLPLELLAQVAAGRDSLKVMRSVCKVWKQAYERSVGMARMFVAAHTLLHSLPGIVKFEGLQAVRLSGCVEEVDLSPLQGSRVRRLDLSGCSGVTALLLSTLRGSFLKGLVLQGCSRVSNDSIAALVGLGVPLEHLDIGNTYVSDEGLEMLRSLSSLTSLSFCDFEHGWVTERGVRVLGELRLANLELGVGRSNYVDTSEMQWLVEYNYEHLRHDPRQRGRGFGIVDLRCLQAVQFSLTRLRLGDGKFTFRTIVDQDFAVLMGLPLTDLELENCGHISDEGLLCLRGMPLKRLCLAVFPECSMTRAGLQVFSGMPLESLKLEFLHPKDFGAGSLAFIRTLRLSEVNFSGFSFTDEDMSHFAGQRLLTLALSNCDLVSEEALCNAIEGMPLLDLSLFWAYTGGSSGWGSGVPSALLGTLVRLPLKRLKLGQFDSIEVELEVKAALLAAHPHLDFSVDKVPDLVSSDDGSSLDLAFMSSDDDDDDDEDSSLEFDP